MESIHAGWCTLGLFQSAGGRGYFCWKMAHVLADVSWLTCATTASDSERWKVLLCFSLVGHEPKVGHKTFAHDLKSTCYMLANIELFQILDRLLQGGNIWIL